MVRSNTDAPGTREVGPKDSSNSPADVPAAETSGARVADTRQLARDAFSALRSLFAHLAALFASLGRAAFGNANRVTRASLSTLRARRSHRIASDGAPLPSPDPQPPRRPRRRIWLRAVGATAALALVLATGLVLYCLYTLPVDGGLQVEAQSALTLEAERGEVFAVRGNFRGERVNAADLPPHLIGAVLAIEDRRFYSHYGIDVRGTLRAFWRNMEAGATREGGSTITQQLARLMFLSSERSWRRKMQEALLALWLERQLTKEEILLRYLNTAYFGAGAYGVDAAAQRYFGKKTKDLSLAESAMLAGLVRAPSQLAPNRNLGGAKERADTVLRAMVSTRTISEQQGEAARNEAVALRAPPDAAPGTKYFGDLVAQDLRRVLGPASGDLTVRTTIDLNLQRLAEGIVERTLERESARRNANQAALVALAPDGAILALVGGRDYENSQFNRATQAKRHAGSLFKLVVYATAFQRGFNPQSVLVDRPIQIGDWEPQNASGQFRGPVNLRTAFAQSINTVAVQLAEQVSVPAVIETAKRLGIQSPLPKVPSLALGVAEVNLLEMTAAFAAVSANRPVEPYSARSISGGASRQLLYARRGSPSEQSSTATPEVRAMMLDILGAVVNEGTGRGAKLQNTAAFGKTGTSQDHRDAWFIGFTSDLIVGVWVGNDDNSPTNKVSGGDLPAAIWRDFVSRARPEQARVADAQRPNAGNQPVERAGPKVPDTAPPLRGRARVIDTATLELNGQPIRLFGITGEGGRRARQLASFIGRREITCDPGTSEVRRCRIDGEDLSTMILAAGGAKAASDAPPEMLSAEEQARSERLGVWGR